MQTVNPGVPAPRVLHLVAAALCLCFQAFPPSAKSQGGAPAGGTIAGKIAAPDDDFLEGLRRGKKLLRYDTHSHSAEPIEPYRLSEVSVVYIETAPGNGPRPAPSRNPELNQQQMVFRPLVLPVVAGTTVDFPNNDDLFHNVFSYSKAGEFDLGRYPKGHRKSVTFAEPGIINVFCDIHSYMFATIIVLDNPYFALPADDGTYAIGEVPPGTYDLAFWYGRKKISAKKVTVKDGQTTTVDFP
jgi:plastocyanin